MFITTILLLFYGMGDETLFNTKVKARLVICPVLFVAGIIWKSRKSILEWTFRKNIHERIIKKRRISYV